MIWFGDLKPEWSVKPLFPFLPRWSARSAVSLARGSGLSSAGGSLQDAWGLPCTQGAWFSQSQDSRLLRGAGHLSVSISRHYPGHQDGLQGRLGGKALPQSGGHPPGRGSGPSASVESSRLDATPSALGGANRGHRLWRAQVAAHRTRQRRGGPREDSAPRSSRGRKTCCRWGAQGSSDHWHLDVKEACGQGHANTRIPQPGGGCEQCPGSGMMSASRCSSSLVALYCLEVVASSPRYSHC